MSTPAGTKPPVVGASVSLTTPTTTVINGGDDPRHHIEAVRRRKTMERVQRVAANVVATSDRRATAPITTTTSASSSSSTPSIASTTPSVLNGVVPVKAVGETREQEEARLRAKIAERKAKREAKGNSSFSRFRLSYFSNILVSLHIERDRRAAEAQAKLEAEAAERRRLAEKWAAAEFERRRREDARAERRGNKEKREVMTQQQLFEQEQKRLEDLAMATARRLAAGKPANPNALSRKPKTLGSGSSSTASAATNASGNTENDDEVEIEVEVEDGPAISLPQQIPQASHPTVPLQQPSALRIASASTPDNESPTPFTKPATTGTSGPNNTNGSVVGSSGVYLLSKYPNDPSVASRYAVDGITTSSTSSSVTTNNIAGRDRQGHWRAGNEDDTSSEISVDVEASGDLDDTKSNTSNRSGGGGNIIVHDRDRMARLLADSTDSDAFRRAIAEVNNDNMNNTANGSTRPTTPAAARIEELRSSRRQTADRIAAEKAMAAATAAIEAKNKEDERIIAAAAATAAAAEVKAKVERERIAAAAAVVAELERQRVEAAAAAAEIERKTKAEADAAAAAAAALAAKKEADCIAAAEKAAAAAALVAAEAKKKKEADEAAIVAAAAERERQRVAKEKEIAATAARLVKEKEIAAAEAERQKRLIAEANAIAAERQRVKAELEAAEAEHKRQLEQEATIAANAASVAASAAAATSAAKSSSSQQSAVQKELERQRLAREATAASTPSGSVATGATGVPPNGSSGVTPRGKGSRTAARSTLPPSFFSTENPPSTANAPTSSGVRDSARNLAMGNEQHQTSAGAPAVTPSIAAAAPSSSSSMAPSLGSASASNSSSIPSLYSNNMSSMPQPPPTTGWPSQVAPYPYLYPPQPGMPPHGVPGAPMPLGYPAPNPPMPPYGYPASSAYPATAVGAAMPPHHAFPSYFQPSIPATHAPAPIPIGTPAPPMLRPRASQPPLHPHPSTASSVMNGGDDDEDRMSMISVPESIRVGGLPSPTPSRRGERKKWDKQPHKPVILARQHGHDHDESYDEDNHRHHHQKNNNVATPVIDDNRYNHNEFDQYDDEDNGNDDNDDDHDDNVSVAASVATDYSKESVDVTALKLVSTGAAATPQQEAARKRFVEVCIPFVSRRSFWPLD
jgi:hypothetical protein